MCFSPKTSRSNINSLFNLKNTNKNTSKEDKNNKLSKKRLSSRNNENLKNQKKNLYKKIVPNNLIQFSSNNSTSSNNSHLNNVKTNNFIFKDLEFKNPNYIKRNIKYFKRQDYSKILMNNSKEKIDKIFQKYNKKIYNSHINNNIKTNHNRSSSKNLNQDLVISKIVDKLVIDNINKINKLNINLNSNQNKFELEKTFLGSLTTKDYNPYLKSNSKNNINFPISTNYKNIISINNINSLGNSRHSALTSSTRNINIRKTSRQMKSGKPNRPNSNDNIKKNKNIRHKYVNDKNGKIMDLSKSKEIKNNITFNNYYKKPNKYSGGVGLNNNKIESVQINLFNNGHEDKFSREKNNIFNKIEKKSSSNLNSNMKNIKKTKEKEVKLFENDLNGSNDGLYMTKSFLSYNDKSRISKDLCTPEENHFQAVNYIQLIQKNNKKFS